MQTNLITPPLFDDTRLPGRFWAKVRVLPNGCWEWTGKKNRWGYGRYWKLGRERQAHRIAYETLVGIIPVGLEPDHLCHNGSGCAAGRNCPHRACVNTVHIELVTRRENLLRGNTIPAANAKKTHCPQGHPYDEMNTLYDQGKRKCKICTAGTARRASKRYYRKHHPIL